MHKILSEKGKAPMEGVDADEKAVGDEDEDDDYIPRDRLRLR